jgi:hypothetical protein
MKNKDYQNNDGFLNIRCAFGRNEEQVASYETTFYGLRRKEIHE